jgi:hypothetical protein
MRLSALWMAFTLLFETRTKSAPSGALFIDYFCKDLEGEPTLEELRKELAQYISEYKAL